MLKLENEIKINASFMKIRDHLDWKQILINIDKYTIFKL